MLKIHPFGQIEKLQIFRVRPRPSAFNVVNTDIIQPQCYFDLLIGRKTDVFSLGAIP